MELQQLQENYIRDAEVWLKSQDCGELGRDERRWALERFKELGLPHRKMESWKYTSLTKFFPERLCLENDNASTLEKEQLQAVLPPNTYRLVLVNGSYNPELSELPNQLRVTPWSGGREKLEDSFQALNHALAQSPIHLELPRNIQIAKPIVVVHFYNGKKQNTLLSPRLMINQESFSELSIVELFISDSDTAYERNAFTEFRLEDGARAKHVKVTLEKHDACHIGTLRAVLEKDSSFSSFTLSLSGKLTRNNILVDLNQSGAEAHVHGLYALQGEQHCDNYGIINHNHARTNSDQLFKGILDDQSRGIFNCKILVGRDAQEVNSSQLNKNLILSKKAHVDTRPQLEVYADDVKCSHGATVGQLGEEEVFYLESRGIPKERALKILCHAFAFEALEKVALPDMRDWLSQLLYEGFEKNALERLEYE